MYTDVHKVENYPFLVKHPFTDSAFATIAKNPEKVTENKVINILESESNLNRWREYVAEQIDSDESADEIYCRITKPYRLTFMKYTVLLCGNIFRKRISPKCCARLGYLPKILTAMPM